MKVISDFDKKIVCKKVSRVHTNRLDLAVNVIYTRDNFLADFVIIESAIIMLRPKYKVENVLSPSKKL